MKDQMMLENTPNLENIMVIISIFQTFKTLYEPCYKLQSEGLISLMGNNSR